VLSDLQAEFGMAPAAEESEKQNAAQLLFLSCLLQRSREQVLLLQCHDPPRELLLHLLVYHWI
jgi:hypothetical protein